MNIKKLFCCTFIFSLITINSAFAYPIRVFNLGEYINYDLPPYVTESSVMLPLKATFEGLGGKVQINSNKKEATVLINSNTIKIIAESNLMDLNGKAITLTNAPSFVAGQIYISLEAVAQATGMGIGYDKTRNFVIFGVAVDSNKNVIPCSAVEYDIYNEFPKMENLKSLYVVPSTENLEYNFELKGFEGENKHRIFFNFYKENFVISSNVYVEQIGEHDFKKIIVYKDIDKNIKMSELGELYKTIWPVMEKQGYSYDSLYSTFGDYYAEYVDADGIQLERNAKDFIKYICPQE